MRTIVRIDTLDAKNLACRSIWSNLACPIRLLFSRHRCVPAWFSLSRPLYPRCVGLGMDLTIRHFPASKSPLPFFFHSSPLLSSLGILLGVFFSVEGPQDKNTFGKTVQRQVRHEDISRRWCGQNPKLRLKELRLGIMIKAKDDTDLNRKRLYSPLKGK
jgi:hypothetical protein